MKIFELIGILNEEEVKFLKKHLPIESKVSYDIFVELLKSNEEDFKLNKGKIYRKIFLKPMTPKLEASFRNKLSDLYDELKLLVVHKWQCDTKQLNIIEVELYLKHLMIKRSFKLFDKEWKFYKQTFELEGDYFALSRLYSIKYSRTMRAQIKNEKEYFEAMDYTKSIYKYYTINYLEFCENLKFYLLNSNYLAKYYGIGEHMDISFFTKIEEEVKANTTFFTSLANELLAEEQDEKKEPIVAHIKEILKTRIHEITLKEKKNLCHCLFNLSIVYSNNNNVEKSLSIQRFLLKNELTSFCATEEMYFYFNYSTNLIKINQWDEALMYHNMIIDKYTSTSNNYFNEIKIRIPLLNVFLGKLDDVYPYLNELFSTLQKEEEKIYTRIIFIIYFLKMKQYDDAKRECDNIKRSPFYNTPKTKTETSVVRILSQIVNIYYSNNEEGLKSQLLKFKKESAKNTFYVQSTLLLMIWIRNFIDKELEEMN